MNGLKHADTVTGKYLGVHISRDHRWDKHMRLHNSEGKLNPRICSTEYQDQQSTS